MSSIDPFFIFSIKFISRVERRVPYSADVGSGPVAEGALSFTHG